MIVQELASILAKARVTKTRASNLSESMRASIAKMSQEDGYEVMKKTAQVLEREYKGWGVTGFKVGATARPAQEKMGLNGPFWGYIYSPAKMVAPHRGGNIPRFSVDQDMIRGVETEFAFTIDKDIVPRSQAYTGEEIVLDYCDTVIPCVEVCGFRLPLDISSLASMLIADTGNAAVVFPPADSHARLAKDVYKDLAQSAATISMDGEQVAHGTGAEVLGSPVKSLEWLAAEVCIKHRLTIPKGSFVITGATSGLRPVTSACYMHAAFSGMSKADIHIAFRA